MQEKKLLYHTDFLFYFLMAGGDIQADLNSWEEEWDIHMQLCQVATGLWKAQQGVFKTSNKQEWFAIAFHCNLVEVPKSNMLGLFHAIFPLKEGYKCN